jgi:predicted GIY-YIG superfamily endonuclease
MGFWVYVLLCSQKKWYVGATKRKPDVRFQEHLGGLRASAWCKKYKPIRIVQIRQYNNELEMLVFEKLTTFELMKEKGYEQVRGANFCQLKPLDVIQLSWDMAQLTGEDANKLIQSLSPNGPLERKYSDLVKDVPDLPKGVSKYFIQ